MKPRTLRVGLLMLLNVASWRYLRSTVTSAASALLLPSGARCWRGPATVVAPWQGRLRYRGLSKSADCDEFEECWRSDSQSVNPHNDARIDAILQSLTRPAPQSLYVVERALRMAPPTTTTTSVLKSCAYLLRDGRRFWCRAGPGGTGRSAGVDWTAAAARPAGGADVVWVPVPQDGCIIHESTMRLVDGTLDLLLEAYASGHPVDEATVDAMYARIRARLALTLGTDVRGRTAADVAFLLALTGCRDEALLQALARVASLELRRVRGRTARTTKDLLQVAEKLAAAGVRGRHADEVYRLTADVLGERDVLPQVARQLAAPGGFDLLSPRPLLWLWRFASRLAKPTAAPTERHTASPAIVFRDNMKPLVIDLGCGLGVSLIGLANLQDPRSNGETPLADWSACNFLGCDLNPILIRYGSGVAVRWGLEDRLQLVAASVEALLDRIVAEYKGPVELIMIQFPTPFRSSFKERGNHQLPSLSAPEDGFMISKSVMYKIANILRPHGTLLIQSNCEDVAIYLRNLAMSCGFRSLPAREPVQEPLDQRQRLTKRTEQWIGRGGERAVGCEWAAGPLLPNGSATESEVACQIQETPVHRVLFRTRT